MENRKAAIKWFSMLKEKFAKTEYEGYLDMVISALEKQDADRWIPVTERLPEKEGLYLVAVKNDHDRRYSKTAWFYRGAWSLARQKILAWRPTPEPYTEDES